MRWNCEISMDSLFKRLSVFITQNLTCLKISGALKICLGGKVTEYKIPINSESPFHIKLRKQRYLGCFKYCFVDIWLEKKHFRLNSSQQWLPSSENSLPLIDRPAMRHYSVILSYENISSRIKKACNQEYKLNYLKVQQLTHTRFVYIIIRV